MVKTMSSFGHGLLVTVLVLSTCVWVGGYVAIGVVARTATATMEPAARVAFFRSLGRTYLRIGTPALGIALISGAVVASSHAWDGASIACLVVAIALVVLLAYAVQQARRMTRLRRSALDSGENPAGVDAIRRGQRSASILRAALGVLSLILVVLGCFMTG